MIEQQDQMVLFHHAGGNAAAMNAIGQYFSPEFATLLMEMPGRGRRRQEDLMRDAGQLMYDLASRIPTEGRLVLVGHSLGAYMAYLLAGYYKNLAPEREIILVVLSNDPIHCRKRFTWLDHGQASEQELWDFAAKLGEIPEWLKHDNVLRQQFLEVLAADLEVANSIQPETTNPLQDVPLLVIYGDDDPYLSSPPIRWSECTGSIYSIESVPGGHFIQLEQAQRIGEIICQFISVIDSKVQCN